MGASVVLVTSGAAPALAAPLPYAVDPQHTQVHWEVKHFGTSTMRGRFGQVAVRLWFDRVGRTGEVSVEVGTASVDTGIPPLDGMLRDERFFQSTASPTAWFVSRKFRFDGDRLVALDGELTLRDVSMPLTLTAVRFSCGPRPGETREVCGGDFEGEVKRSDFGIHYGLPFVGDRVRLVVQVEAFAP